MKPANKQQKLQARQTDYDRMTSQTGWKGTSGKYGSYHRPGSNKK